MALNIADVNKQRVKTRCYKMDRADGPYTKWSLVKFMHEVKAHLNSLWLHAFNLLSIYLFNSIIGCLCRRIIVHFFALRFYVNQHIGYSPG